MGKDESIRETERLKECKKCLEIIKQNNFDADETLEQLKAITLRWYLNGKTDGLDYGNEKIFDDYEL